MRLKALLLALACQAMAAFAHDGAKPCQACHAREQNERSCVRCHVSPVVPREGRSAAGLYAAAPTFDSAVLARARPFDATGLALYLENPPSRRRHYGGMFVMGAAQARSTTSALASWTQRSSYQPDPSLQGFGEKLFAEQGCLSCHGEQGLAPRLPIGMALYNYQYFTAILAGEATYYRAGQRPAMPAFPALSQTESKALYSYISLARIPAVEELQEGTLSSSNWLRLAKDVEGIFRRNGCAHCHSSSEQAQAEIKRTFGGTPENLQLAFDKDGIQLSGAALRRDAHGSNRLIEALSERRAEWRGHNDASRRGMPLGLPALSDSELRTVRQWVKLGCPLPKQSVCE